MRMIVAGWIAGKVLSLRGVYTWFQAYEADGTVALAPAVTRRRQDHPEWLNGFLRFYCTPAKISIGHALEKYAALAAAGCPCSELRPGEAGAQGAAGHVALSERPQGSRGAGWR